MTSTKLHCKENRYFLSCQPFYNQTIPVDDSIFSNNANEGLSSRNTLNSLPSLYDINLFTLNAPFDNDVNPDTNLYNVQRRDCPYYSPYSFDICKNRVIKHQSTLSFLHNNVRSLKKNLEAFQNQLFNELSYHFTILAVTETKIVGHKPLDFNPVIPGYNDL